MRTQSSQAPRKRTWRRETAPSAMTIVLADAPAERLRTQAMLRQGARRSAHVSLCATRQPCACSSQATHTPSNDGDMDMPHRRECIRNAREREQRRNLFQHFLLYAPSQGRKASVHLPHLNLNAHLFFSFLSPAHAMSPSPPREEKAEASRWAQGPLSETVVSRASVDGTNARGCRSMLRACTLGAMRDPFAATPGSLGRRRGRNTAALCSAPYPSRPPPARMAWLQEAQPAGVWNVCVRARSRFSPQNGRLDDDSLLHSTSRFVRLFSDDTTCLHRRTESPAPPRTTPAGRRMLAPARSGHARSGHGTTGGQH